MADIGGHRDEDSRWEEDLVAVVVCAAAACSTFILLSFVSVRNSRHGRRLGNRIRNRATFAQVTTFLSDAEFHRAFRRRRTSFMELLSVLKTELSRDQRMEMVSSGSPVEPAVRLALTLRVLGGGSHHDLAMLFRIATITVYALFNATIIAINNLLALPGVPLEDIEKLQKLAERFVLSRWTHNPLFGVVGALDGIALKITKPDDEHVPRNYWCRKGYYAIPVKAVMDSSYRLMHISAMAVGSTHDSLPFPFSKLGIALENGGLPDGYWIAADAAYECLNCILSPWSERQVKDHENGVARDAFNYYQRSSRVHV
jgi:DDE superfamily endonuclease